MFRTNKTTLLTCLYFLFVPVLQSRSQGIPNATLMTSAHQVNVIQSTPASIPLPVKTLPTRLLTDSGLTIAGPSVITELNARGMRDFGGVDPLSVDDLRQDFILTNTSVAPLKIMAIRPSCRCTTVSIADGNDILASAAVTAATPLVIQPGGSTTLKVDVSLSDAVPGTFEKSVTLDTSLTAGIQPAIFMRFKVEPSVQLQPQVINFGSLNANHGSRASLLLSFDGRLQMGGVVPRLVSSNPYVIISPGPTIIQQTVGQAPVKQMQTRAYTVSVSHEAPLGPIRSMLSFDASRWPVDQARPRADAVVARFGAFWSSANTIVVANVVGDATAIPSSLSYGIVNADKASVRTVKIVGTSAALSRVRSASSADWFVITLSAMDRSLQPTSNNETKASVDCERTLTITLTPHLTAGLLSGNVEMRLGNGQMLVIPVSAYVPPST